MMFKVPVSALSKALAIPFLDWPRMTQICPILGNVKFEVADGKLTILMTDTSGWRIGFASLGEEYAKVSGEFTVPFGELKEIMGLVSPEATMSFEDMGGTVDIAFDSCKYSLPTLPAEDYPQRQPQTVETRITVSSSELVSALKRMLFTVATRRCADAQLNTVSILLKDGVLWLRGGQGILLSNIPIPTVEVVGDGCGPWSVPYALCAMLAKAAFLPPELTLNLNAKTVSIELAQGVVEAMLNHENKWMNMDAIYPSEVEHDLVVDSAVLSQFVQRATVTAKDPNSTFVLRCNGDGTASVLSQTKNTGAFVSSFPIDYAGKFQLAFNSKAFLGILDHAFNGQTARMVCGRGRGKGTFLRVALRPLAENRGWYVISPILLEQVEAPGVDGGDENNMNILPAKRRGNR